MAALQGANERDDCDQERQVGACCESAGWGAESASRGWSSFSPLKADCLVSSRLQGVTLVSPGLSLTKPGEEVFEL